MPDSLIDRILALHVEVNERGFHYCQQCCEYSESDMEWTHADWPCPTVRLIREATPA